MRLSPLPTDLRWPLPLPGGAVSTQSGAGSLPVLLGPQVSLPGEGQVALSILGVASRRGNLQISMINALSEQSYQVHKDPIGYVNWVSPY